MLNTAKTVRTTEDTKEKARLTPEERRALLNDIGHIAFTLGQSSGAYQETASVRHEAVIPASSAHRLRAGAITSPLERLHLLTALWQEMQPALGAILNGAGTHLVNHAPSVLLAQARGGPGTAHAVARSPHLSAFWVQFRDDGSAPASRNRKQAVAHLSRAFVSESRSGVSANTWSNRLTVRILTDVTQEAALLGRLATFCEAIPEAETALCLAARARALRLHPVLRDCPALSEPEAAPTCCASQILRCALPYQILYGAWRQLAYPLDFDWTHSPLLTLPALEPWHLYEIWCLIQTVAALHQAGWQLTRGELLQATPRGLRLVSATGRASRLDFQQSTVNSLSLYYQPLFASANQQATRSEREAGEFAFVSRSHAMQPDIVLHRRGRLYILDPKFRPYARVEEAQKDINKMHAYRDAIIKRGSTSRRLASPVEAAWCLFPGATPGEVPDGFGGVYAYPIASPEHPFGTAGVGALRLRPGHPQTTQHLAALLTFLLASA